jgi:hypothetical protein
LSILTGRITSNRHPRLERTDGTFSIKTWNEEAVRLLVDRPVDESINGHFLIEVPCCEALSPVLLESDMLPGSDISANKPSLLTTPNLRFPPYADIRSQTASREPQSKMCIPTISRYVDALLAQSQWLVKMSATHRTYPDQLKI